MQHPVIVRAEQMIRTGDAVGAERALVALAESEGDQALAVVLQEFPAKDLLAVMRDFDSSRESVVGLLVAPEQFARAIVLERRYADLDHERLRGMINSVIFRAGSDPAEFLMAIADVEEGCETLADYLGERLDNVEHFFRTGSFDFFEEGDRSWAELEDSERLDALSDCELNRPFVSLSEVTDHDWMELTWLLRYEQPEVFRDVLLILRARARAAEANESAIEMPADTLPAASAPEEESAL